MQVYLVGGAVRDQLLGLKITERDWVVVDSTPEELMAQNYQAVGRDFPVFLHPKTKEEYALARTERKSAPGYYGFQCDFNSDVSLEQDLLRRDLTINAIAMDVDGKIIDPNNGVVDLANRHLRHVSEAFVEDPVRVLRVARFMAKFGHMGFTIVEPTQKLMQSMVQCDELAYLVPERVWQEWEKSLSLKSPHLFIETLKQCGALKIIVPELDELLQTTNLPLTSLQQVEFVVASPELRFAALMYLLEAQSIQTLCARLRIPKKYLNLAVMLSKFYSKINTLKTLSADGVIQVLEQTDAFRRPELFEQLLIACDVLLLDRQLNSVWWRMILHVCSLIKPVNINLTGPMIKQDLYLRRVMAAQEIKVLYEK